MTAAKGSDVLAACDEALVQEIAKAHWTLLHEGDIQIPQHIVEIVYMPIIQRFVQARVQAAIDEQAAAVEMREQCAKHEPTPHYQGGEYVKALWLECSCGWKSTTSKMAFAEHIRALPILTSALDAMLLRARIEGAETMFGGDDLQNLNRVASWKDELAALTQPTSSPELPLGMDSSDKRDSSVHAVAPKDSGSSLTQPAPEKEQKG